MLRRLFIFLLLAAAPLTAAKSIVYKSADNRKLHLHIEKPSDWKPTDKRPAVVFFFGGGWVGGSAEQFLPQSKSLADQGAVGIRVEYRTIPNGDPGPPVVCCADAKSAMRFVSFAQEHNLGLRTMLATRLWSTLKLAASSRTFRKRFVTMKR
jgi:acetyl esterase/lipase